MVKNKFRARFCPIWLKFGPPNFFKKNLASSVTRYHGQLSSCTISNKPNDPILRKLSDGRTDGQTGGLTDESDFIGRCRLTSSVQQIKFQNKKKIKLGSNLSIVSLFVISSITHDSFNNFWNIFKNFGSRLFSCLEFSVK